MHEIGIRKSKVYDTVIPLVHVTPKIVKEVHCMNKADLIIDHLPTRKVFYMWNYQITNQKNILYVKLPITNSFLFQAWVFQQQQQKYLHSLVN